MQFPVEDILAMDYNGAQAIVEEMIKAMPSLGITEQSACEKVQKTMMEYRAKWNDVGWSEIPKPTKQAASPASSQPTASVEDAKDLNHHDTAADSGATPPFTPAAKTGTTATRASRAAARV